MGRTFTNRNRDDTNWSSHGDWHSALGVLPPTGGSPQKTEIT